MGRTDEAARQQAIYVYTCSSCIQCMLRMLRMLCTSYRAGAPWNDRRHNPVARPTPSANTGAMRRFLMLCIRALHIRKLHRNRSDDVRDLGKRMCGLQPSQPREGCASPQVFVRRTLLGLHDRPRCHGHDPDRLAQLQARCYSLLPARCNPLQRLAPF
jgi:hypothetical protein